MIAKYGIALAAAALWALGGQEADEKEEPPVIYHLEVDGKRIPVDLDRPVELETKTPRTKVTLRAEAHRVFNLGGVRFHYPRDMGFEADFSEPQVRLWTLDGNNAVLMVQRLLGEGSHEAVRKRLVNELVQQYGAGSVTRSASTMVLQKKSLSGMTLKVNVAGSMLSQAVYSFQAGKDSMVLILQDSLTDDGKPTDEYLRIVKMLEATFEFPAEGK